MGFAWGKMCAPFMAVRTRKEGVRERADIFFLKHDSSICCFSMMDQVRLCAVWPTVK